ncbi:DNA-3-methyladenine glycosylase 2 family protein [Alkaliphilus pronyensis]|uniref:DNA-3-methyladenine glycosylase II n=1 Tax=Alkaliphilus pronyensis TaxID=1482732 RepID=A0A6I0F7S3_9FIRM|nr:DNA-3-methyladenine glycosylase [Alkaliphilus pronyensis]KAB3530767.1 DNA-3-methyladenine glycosylase 2 family protein [Alkaliphilus pronyensis]
MNRYFQYGQKEIEYLKKKDKKLSAAIDRIGMIKRVVMPNPFEALIFSIIGQQISNKAAETVWNRFCILVGSVTPENILKIKKEAIQECGMTTRKAGYILGIAETAMGGAIEFHKLHLLPDKDIIKILSCLNGVGIWTAEMLLIHSLNRLDIVSYGDLAIRRGMMKLYDLKDLSKEQFEIYRTRYSPYGSVASLYLWELSVE